jgi:hypothetical protein
LEAIAAGLVEEPDHDVVVAHAGVDDARTVELDIGMMAKRILGR